MKIQWQVTYEPRDCWKSSPPNLSRLHILQFGGLLAGELENSLNITRYFVTLDRFWLNRASISSEISLKLESILFDSALTTRMVS